MSDNTERTPRRRGQMTPDEIAAEVERWTQQWGLPRYCEDDRILNMVGARIAAVLGPEDHEDDPPG